LDRRQQQSKEPVWAAVAGPYGHPFHPILVTIPIGAWVCAFVFDIASRFTQPQQFSTGAMWLIGIGVLGGLAAASIGALDLFAIPPGTPAKRTGWTHAGLNLAVIVAFGANFAWRYAARNSSAATPIGPLTLSLVGLLVLVVSGSLGGKLAYRYGVRVAAEDVQADGFVSTQRRAGQSEAQPLP
jgi:uncharacterized membrane protein